MLWLLLAFVCAFSEASKDIVSKKGLLSIPPIQVTWIFFVLSTLCISPVAYFYLPEKLSIVFWFCLFLHGTLFGVSVYLYMQAISLSDLSITVPLVMFTPLFMVLESPFIHGVTPSWIGISGVLCIVLGSFLLNSGSAGGGFLRPIRALLDNKGARIMLLVAFIWSITAYIDKKAVQEVPPMFWAFADYFFITCILTKFLFLKGQIPFSLFRTHSRLIYPVGIWNFIQLVTYAFAMKLGNPIYVLSIKRSSVLMVILYSWLVYKEKNISEKMFGSLVMLGGVILISIS